MIDLHCHILPGIDDGSASLEESCLMARMAADSGVTAIAATPHCNIPGRVDNYLSPRLRDSFLAMARLIKEQKFRFGSQSSGYFKMSLLTVRK